MIQKNGSRKYASDLSDSQWTTIEPLFPRAGNRGKWEKRELVDKDDDPVPTYKAEDITQIREAPNLSQRALSSVLGFSPRTVETWEARRNLPSGAARHLRMLWHFQRK